MAAEDFFVLAALGEFEDSAELEKHELASSSDVAYRLTDAP